MSIRFTSPCRRRFLTLFYGVLVLVALTGSPAGPIHAQMSQAPHTAAYGSVGEDSTPISASREKREQEVDENNAYRHSAAVRKLGSLIGLDADQAATAFTVLNFFVLAALVGYFALKLLPKKFRERSSAIQRQLVEAKTATAEASARLNAIEDRLGRLDGEIATMREHLEAETRREEQRIQASVADEAAKIIAVAEGEIATATSAARRELQRHAADLAIQYAAQRLVVTDETDKLLIQGFVGRLKGERVQN